MSISMNRFSEESTTLKKLRITKLGLTHKEEFQHCSFYSINYPTFSEINSHIYTYYNKAEEKVGTHLFGRV